MATITEGTKYLTITMQVDTGEDYYVAGKMLRTRLDKETEESVEELTAIATLEVGEDTYKSNENSCP